MSGIWDSRADLPLWIREPGQELKNLRQIQKYLQNGKNVSIETCLPKEALDLMRTAKQNGYEVNLHFVKTGHAAEGYRRGLNNEAITPKELPAIIKGNDQAFRNLEGAISLSDHTTIYNNHRGQELQVVNTFQNGRSLDGNPFVVPPGIKECSLAEKSMGAEFKASPEGFTSDLTTGKGRGMGN